MRPVVLVHGAWHGPWCWHRVLDGLAAAGIDATAVHLPLAEGPGVDADTVRAALAGLDLVFCALPHGESQQQMSALTAVVPHVIDRITTPAGKVIYTRSEQQLGRIVEARYVGMMNQMMQETLATGTARETHADVTAFISAWRARTGVTPEELTRAKNQFRAAKVNERQQTFAMGEAVQNATFFLGSPDAVNSDLDRYAKVTVDDVKRVAATYLIPANSLVVTVLPEAK